MNHLIKSNAKSPYPISWLICDEETENSILHMLAKKNNVDVAKTFLDYVKQEIIAKQPDENKRLADYHDYIGKVNHEGKSALHLACEYAQFNMLDLLIAEGADLFQINQQKEEPLIIAINHHTVEEQADNERTTARLKTIKLLLQHNVGLGVDNLAQKLKDKNVIPAANEFPGVMVIASNVTQNDPGFEQAICTLQDFVDNLNQNNSAEFNEKSEKLLKLSYKRLSEHSRPDSPKRVELSNFIRLLDFRMPRNLVRQCLRYIEFNNEIVEKTKSGVEQRKGKIPPILILAIRREAIARTSTLNYNNIQLLLTYLKELKNIIKNEPEVISKFAHIQTAQHVRNISFGLMILLLVGGVGYFLTDRFLDCLSGDNDRPCTDDDDWIIYTTLSYWGILVTTVPLLLCCGVVMICNSHIVGSPAHVWFNRIKSILITNPDDIVTYLNECSTELLDKKALAQDILNLLVSDNLIPRELTNNFENTTHLTALSSVIKSIKTECKNLMSEQQNKQSIFYTPKAKSNFFPSPSGNNKQITSNANELIVELDDDDEATPLMNIQQQGYGAVNHSTNEEDDQGFSLF